MKYFKDSDNNVYAYEDDFDEINTLFFPITENDAMGIANPPPTKEDLISQAEDKRNSLLKAADDIMLDWRTELMLGVISDSNRDKLSLWLSYKNDVKAADVSSYPSGKTFPPTPAV